MKEPMHFLFHPGFRMILRIKPGNSTNHPEKGAVFRMKTRTYDHYDTLTSPLTPSLILERKANHEDIRLERIN